MNGSDIDDRLDIYWIEFEGALEKSKRFLHVFGGRPLVPGIAALENQGHYIRMRQPFRSARLDLDNLGIQGVGKPGDYFILHVEEVGNGLVKTLGPDVLAGFGIDQLHIHPEAVAAPLHRPFECVTDVQLASELPDVHGFALVGERRVAGDHEGAGDA